MALIIETEKYRHKVDKDFIIIVLQLDAEDEDYREPAFIWKQVDLGECWYVSLNHNFLDDYEKLEEE